MPSYPTMHLVFGPWGRLVPKLTQVQTLRASLGEAEHGVDLAEVLDAVAGVVLCESDSIKKNCL